VAYVIEITARSTRVLDGRIAAVGMFSNDSIHKICDESKSSQVLKHSKTFVP